MLPISDTVSAMWRVLSSPRIFCRLRLLAHPAIWQPSRWKWMHRSHFGLGPEQPGNLMLQDRHQRLGQCDKIWLVRTRGKWDSSDHIFRTGRARCAMEPSLALLSRSEAADEAAQHAPLMGPFYACRSGPRVTPRSPWLSSRCSRSGQVDLASTQAAVLAGAR